MIMKLKTKLKNIWNIQAEIKNKNKIIMKTKTKSTSAQFKL